MKAILEFNLPEDRDEYEINNKAINYYCAIHEIKEYLMRIDKHESVDNRDPAELLEEIRSRVYEILNDEKVL